MDPAYDIPIVSMCYGVTVGYYDILRDVTCIATYTGEQIPSIQFCHQIIAPICHHSMIVYNGLDLFKYLDSSDTVIDAIELKATSDDHEPLCKESSSPLEESSSPLDESYYKPFDPDYTSCQLLIQVIGYENEESLLIGY